MKAPRVRQRKSRAGSFRHWERTYKPLATSLYHMDGDGYLRPWHDPEVLRQFQVDPHYVWTVVDTDGVLYLVPGFAVVNYYARVLCAVPYDDAELSNTGYLL